MDSEFFEFADGNGRHSEPQIKTEGTKSQTNESAESVANTAKVKKEKVEPKYEKELREAKEEIKKTKEEIAKLKEIEPKARTGEQKKQLSEMNKRLQENKYRLAKARQEYDRAKNSRSVRQQKKKLEEGKQVAIIKILQAEGIETENEVKNLIRTRKLLGKYGVKDNEHLKNILDYVVRNAK